MNDQSNDKPQLKDAPKSRPKRRWKSEQLPHVFTIRTGADEYRQLKMMAAKTQWSLSKLLVKATLNFGINSAEDTAAKRQIFEQLIFEIIMRKQDLEQIIQLLKEEIDLLRTQNNLWWDESQTFYCQLGLKEEELAQAREELGYLSCQISETFSLVEQAKQILQHQRQLNLSLTKTQANTFLSLQYTMLMIETLEILQTSLLSKKILEKTFININFEWIKQIKEQAGEQQQKYLALVSELK